MRHRVFGRKLDRSANHRKALFRNLIIGLIEHRRIQTTEAKAKAIRGVVDKLITKAKQGTVHARRIVGSFLHDAHMANKLVDEIAPSFKHTTSGYTRITRTSERRGDASMMVRLELTNASDMPATSTKPKRSNKPIAKKKSKTAPAIAKIASKTAVKAPISSKISNQAHRTQSKG